MKASPMMPLGFDRPLYVLPFDHRGSFQTRMFGWEGRLSAEQTAQIAAAKRVIYDGFTAALAAGVSKNMAGILVDEQFGASILRDAAADGYVTACPPAESGPDGVGLQDGGQLHGPIQGVPSALCQG